jgi:hypothetical protein
VGERFFDEEFGWCTVTGFGTEAGTLIKCYTPDVAVAAEEWNTFSELSNWAFQAKPSRQESVIFLVVFVRNLLVSRKQVRPFLPYFLQRYRLRSYVLWLPLAHDSCAAYFASTSPFSNMVFRFLGMKGKQIILQNDTDGRLVGI